MDLLLKIRTHGAISEVIKGNTQKALNKLNRVKKETYQVVYYKGICYFDLNDLENARINLEKANDYHKDEPDLAVLLAQVYLLSNNSEKALKVLMPHQAYSQAKHFIKLIRRGQVEIDKYVLVTNLLSRAMMMLRNGEYSESIQLFEEVLEHTANKEERARLNNQIGGIYMNHFKDAERSKAYFLKAAKLNPKESVYIKNLKRAVNL